MDLSLIVTVAAVLSLSVVEAKNDPDLKCAVCRAVVDEVNYSISQVNPKEKVQVGSFRVDSRGDQKTYTVPLARSELHLTEVFETICEKFKQYGSTKNSVGKKSVVRMQSRDGSPLTLTDISVSYEEQKDITFLCENMVEEYEDDIIDAFRKENEETEAKICKDITGLCTLEDLKIPMPQPGPAAPKDEESEDEDENEEEDESDDEDNNAENTDTKDEL